jgi:hypothetical protein
MRKVRLPSSGATAVAFLILACSTEEPPPAPSSVGGIWIGTLSDGSTTSQAWLDLTQNGTDVAGTLNSMALLGQVSPGSISFSLTSGTGCGLAAKGSGTVSALVDRDRLHLSWFGASCGGSLSGSASVDRMRCGPKLACCDLSGTTLFCTDGTTDEANCGECGVACGAYQMCQAGICTVPACTGPVPLAPPRTVATDPGGPTLAIADVNGDGALDIVLTGSSSAPPDRRLAVLLGDGRGGFGTPLVMQLSMFVLGFALGDVDGDGVLDAVLAGADDYDGPWGLRVLHGKGDGSFALGATLPAGPWLAAAPQHLVALADVDGDGTLDLVTPGPQPTDMVSSGPDPTIEVRRGTGHGTFGPAEAYAVAAHADAIAAADLDLDGRPDLVVVGWSRGRVASILFNQGDGTFGPPVDLPDIDLPTDVKVSDVDGDGLPDILVTGGGYQFTTDRVAIHRGQGNRTFAPPLGLVQDGGDFDFWIEVGDLNGDGHLDVVVASGKGFVVFAGKSDGTFGAGAVQPMQGGTLSLVAADVDGDGAPELVVAGNSTTILHSCPR